MNTVSLIVALAFAALFTYFLARMVWSIGRNLVHGRMFRRKLRERLAGIPLEQALVRSGTDPDDYLHARQIHNIAQEMRNCTDCQVTSECKEALNEGTPAEEFVFCPNYKALFKR
ncbi:MAG: hypothetical protein HY941_09120 [Gammaproteobacteria bacterium]|nr:hypothetical protein [Gammaproteobacteria bacterium]